MSLIREVLRELLGMFWADAGLCLGCLAVVLAVGLGVKTGSIGPGAALAGLTLGIVATLLLNVFAAWRAAGRRRR